MAYIWRILVEEEKNQVCGLEVHSEVVEDKCRVSLWAGHQLGDHCRSGLFATPSPLCVPLTHASLSVFYTWWEHREGTKGTKRFNNLSKVTQLVNGEAGL
jgi:hypothetical protein